MSTTAATLVGVILGSGLGVLPSVAGAVSANQNRTTLEVRLAETEPGAGLTEDEIFGSGQKIYLHAEAIVTQDDIIRASIQEEAGGATFGVVLMFSQPGTERLEKATEAHLGKPLAILINDYIRATPVVSHKMGGSVVLTGDFTKETAQRIAAAFNDR